LFRLKILLSVGLALLLLACGSPSVDKTAAASAGSSATSVATATPAASVSAPAVAAAPPAPAAPAPSAVPVSKTLSAGTNIPIVLLEALDSDVPYLSPFVTGAVDHDVMGADGRLAIPAGARVLMIPSIQGKGGSISRLTLGLFAIDIAGRQSRFNKREKGTAWADFKEDAARGAAHRSVHLSVGTVLNFKLQLPVEL